MRADKDHSDHHHACPGDTACGRSDKLALLLDLHLHGRYLRSCILLRKLDYQSSWILFSNPPQYFPETSNVPLEEVAALFGDEVCIYPIFRISNMLTKWY